MNVLIVGGGLGGLAAALAFRRRGARVQVVEQAPELGEVGAGLQVTPNGARVLRALGVGSAMEAAGLRAEALEPHDALSGRRLARFDLGRRGDWFFFHRADLLALLHEAAIRAGAAIRTGARVAAVWSEGAVLESGEGVPADLVVGADGVHSVVRRRVLGETQPFFTGQVAWRALVDARQEPVARIWMAPGRHAVTYPLRDGRLNLVAVREEAEWAEEGWSHRDSPDALRAAFADAAPPLRAIIDRVTEVGRWGLFRHEVPETWHDGRAVLLGDAAHPTLPFLAQGANLALRMPGCSLGR
jgi:salicylate hydroxylase